MSNAKSVQKVLVDFCKALPKTPTFRDLQSEIATSALCTSNFFSLHQ